MALPHSDVFDTKRIETLSDGVFAIAMTFLVLDVKDAVVEAASSEPILPVLLPKLCSYILGFLILGLFWNGHHVALHYTRRTDRIHLWLNINFLTWAALVPFPAELLGERYAEPIAVVVYGLNLTVAAIALYLIWQYATQNHRLVDRDLPKEIVIDLKRRLMLATLSYAVAICAALIHPYVGVLFFVASHIYFVSQPITRSEAPKPTR